ncbi:MAG TPA: RDD family protein, partial [Candidatus Ozemobacteraceae bacterium]|nr:RDD family protein [Candidatus Ozemobacteraceae bacterium]
YVLLVKVSFLLAQLFLVFICLVFGVVTLFKDGPYMFRFADIALEAQSLGKKFMGLRVLKQDGKTQISWNESAQRNMPLAVPYFLVMLTILITAATSFMPLALQIIPFLVSILVFFICIGIIGFELFNIWKDPQGRRWGDRSAGTTVFMD